jgi:hypothetical protein
LTLSILRLKFMLAREISLEDLQKLLTPVDCFLSS